MSDQERAAARLGCDDRDGARDEPVAQTGQRFHEPGVLGRIPQRAAELVNRGVEAFVELRVRARGPNRLAQFLPRDDVSGLRQEPCQDAKRLVLQLDLYTVTAELARAQVDFERTEPDEAGGLLARFHRASSKAHA